MIFRSQYGRHSDYFHDVARALERDPRPERRREGLHVRKLADQLAEYAKEDEERERSGKAHALKVGEAA